MQSYIVSRMSVGGSSQ